MPSCLAGQRLSAWRSTISQRKVTMTITSSWDVKKACAKLRLLGLSFGFVHPDGSSRCVARGGSFITMDLSTSPQCWLNTSARFLKRRSRQQASRASEPLKRKALAGGSVVPVRRIQHDRHATTSEGHESGEPLAMHQLAVWRVRSGSDSERLAVSTTSPEYPRK